MKNYLILLLFAGLFSFSACSSDDDNPKDTEEPIIGTWILVETSAPINVDACESSSTITFNEDNTGNAVFYLEPDCEAQNSTGTWENKGNGQYQVNVPFGDFPVTTGTVEFEGANDFFFTATGFTFHFQKQ